eukprot:TRINITY_DN14309_c0_g1_i1.p1 TRINITY_DN14309_c0_g1~~TRINITY_DN14309_c0_g1_i1.p1  ORF type:complete len:464 (+),score=118.73 TRINITY_DN14309_c0_g1_i1:257-1648(+)
MEVEEGVKLGESVIDYLMKNAQVMQSLYQDPWTCQAIFRDLPPLAKQYVVRMLFLNAKVSIANLLQWTKAEELVHHKNTLERLRALALIQESINNVNNNNSTGTRIVDRDRLIQLNPEFQNQFRRSVVGEDLSSSLQSTNDNESLKSEEDLEIYSQSCWETILRYILNNSKEPSPKIKQLLISTRLMKKEGNKLDITNEGFQFLLRDTYTQIWSLLLAYLQGLQNKQEALSLLFRLSFLKVGREYSTSELSPYQQEILQDLKEFGIIYFQKKRKDAFYPTRLAITLSSSQSAQNNQNTKTHVSSSNGYIIIEQNYRLYAYTDSPLQISILEQFCKMRYQLPNMIMGVISRESVRKALRSGITANQIIGYLRQHAHPEMQKNFPVVPETVSDQIRLWEGERNRVQYSEGTLYEAFPNTSAFQRTVNYSKDIGVYLWSHIEKERLMVTKSGSQDVSEFIKKHVKT